MSDQALPEEAILKRIQGLLNLASKNTSSEEASSAAAKAQELLARYNLDVATVENSTAIKDGKREQAMVDGGTYAWQRELWGAVAGLNFCVHWVQSYEVWTKAKRVGNGRDRFTTEGYVYKKRHALIGRIVNTRATMAMAGYLQQAIERALLERLHGDALTYQQQRFSTWAVDYRRGATKRLLDKLNDRRSEMEAKEAERLRKVAAEAARAGTTTTTGVTLSTLRKSEADANYDFVHGEGAAARWQARQAERTRARREEREAYTRWAAENPEEAAKKEAERQAAYEKAARKNFNGRTAAAKPKHYSGAFWDGYDAAANIGLDGQVAGTKTAGALRHG